MPCLMKSKNRVTCNVPPIDAKHTRVMQVVVVAAVCADAMDDLFLVSVLLCRKDSDNGGSVTKVKSFASLEKWDNEKAH